MTGYAEDIGLAFQIADDILDIASPAEVSGKTPGTDLREGILTLPMLLVQAQSARIEELQRGLALDPEVLHRLGAQLVEREPRLVVVGEDHHLGIETLKVSHQPFFTGIGHIGRRQRITGSRDNAEIAVH